MSETSEGKRQFSNTRWTLVSRAGSADTARARDALQELCQAYWYPLYAYVRRRGYAPHDAEDRTQGFFTRLLRLKSLAGVSPNRGKFRSFLLAGMNHYLADERARASAQKRDVQRTISRDAGEAENRYRDEPVDALTPERVFERQWALALLEKVVQRLWGEYEAAGRRELFLELRFAITSERDAVPYGEVAARLGMTEAAVRVAVHRLRKRYRMILREEISQTVTDDSEVAAELEHLRAILSA